MNKRSALLWLIATFSSSCLILVSSVYHWQIIPKSLEHYSANLIYPLLVLQNQVVTPVKNYFAKRVDYKNLQSLLNKVQQEHDQVLTENIELRGMIDHLQEVKELVDFKKRYNYENGLLAQVLVRNCSEQSQFYLVDRGSNDGVAVDMVALYKDCILGKVIEVYPRYSKILLITDCTCKVAAVCAQSKALGIYQGLNEEWQSKLEHVSHLSSIERDDLILSTGEGLVFPRGFALGKIKKWSRDGLFYEVSVQPLVDVRALNHCYLVQKGTPETTPSGVGNIAVQ